MALVSQLGPLQVVVRDHVEDLSLTELEHHGDGGLPVLLAQVTGPDQHPDPLGVEHTDRVRGTFQPPLRVVVAIQYAPEVGAVGVDHLDRHDIVTGGTVVVLD